MKTKQRPRRKAKKSANGTLKPDFRPITISGTLDGKEVASDKAAEHWKANSIAAGWRCSGLTVTIKEN